MTRSRAHRRRQKKQGKSEQVPSKPPTSLAPVRHQSYPPVPRFSDLNTSPEHQAVKRSRPGDLPAARVTTRATMVRREVSTFSGPLPPPDILLRYNEAAPNAADRILRMAEEQAHHRQKMEWKALTSDANRSRWGLVCGLIVALAFGVGSVLLGLNGHDTLGAVLGGSTLLGLVTVFVTGTVIRRNERREQAQRMEGRKSRKAAH